MSKSRRNGLIVMLLIVVGLLVLGILTIPLANPTPVEGQPPPNVLVMLIPFVLIFGAIILAFITFIIFAATKLNGNIREEIYRPIEILLIAGIGLGILGMIQPWVLDLYRYGFLLLLVSTLGFIVWSHIVPRGAVQPKGDQTTVSAEEFEQREAGAHN